MKKPKKFKLGKPITFTRKQFEKSYGKCPDYLWEILRQNYKKMKAGKWK